MRARQFAVFLIVGSGFVVLGGLVAAVTGPLRLAEGSWLAAYLVLVCGAAQCAIGAVQRGFLADALNVRTFWAEFVLWNAANLAVMAGTLAGVTAILDLGGAALLAALVLALVVAHRARPHPLVWAYRACIVIMVVSIPVGLILATLQTP